MMPAELLRASLAWTVLESPLGPLTLVGDHDGLHAVYFRGRSGPLDEAARDAAPFADAVTQLEEYFAGERQAFDLPLVLEGTAFQRRVWDVLRTIEYGRTRSYGDARRRDRPPRPRPRGGRGRRPHAGADHRPLPPGDRGRRQPHRLRRRPAAQAGAAGPRVRVRGGAAPPGVWAGRQLSLLA